MKFIFLILLVHSFSAFSQTQSIFVHYMPWYEAKPHSPHWGSHWTMGHFNPDKIDIDGKRDIASHDYPIIGPYDSNDPNVLSYQVQTMKLAGIDGVIIDWYGIEDHLDYGMIHRNTLHLIEHIKKAGLKFIICYEDQTYHQTIPRNLIQTQEAVSFCQKVFSWMEKNWFQDSAYFTLNQQPVLLIFGPQYFMPPQWEKIISSLQNQVLVYSFPHLKESYHAQGCFTWPPVSGGKLIPEFNWKGDLEHIYKKHPKTVIPVVFPGYHDIYAEAGKENSFGKILHQDGQTLKYTLDSAFKYANGLIQIATWNDYGEGTVVEPTQNRGYLYLELIQEKVKTMQSHKKVAKENLRLPLQLFRLKQKLSTQSALHPELIQLDQMLYNNHLDEFKAALQKLQNHSINSQP